MVADTGWNLLTREVSRKFFGRRVARAPGGSGETTRIRARFNPTARRLVPGTRYFSTRCVNSRSWVITLSF